jgi:type IV pilus modification protein PilV
MSFSRRLSRSAKGFTLIEVMIALLILATGLLALMTMQIVSIKANAFSSEMTYSTMLAQQQLETLRNLTFIDANLTVGHHNLALPVIDDKGASYSVSWDVASISTDLRRIDLQVTWQSMRQGAAQQTVLTRMQTMVSQ